MTDTSQPPLRVLLITDYGTLTGGDELLTFDLRDELRKRGHDARVLTSDARPLPQPVVSDYTCRGTTSRWRTLLQSANPFAARTLKRVLAEFDPDMVHVRSFMTQISPTILPLLRDRASIAHFDTLRSICPTGSKLLPDGSECRVSRGRICMQNGCLPFRDWAVLTPQMRACDRGFVDCFDLRVANSAFTLGRLRNHGIGVDTHVWNGTKPPETVPARFDEPTVAFSGRLVPEKGVDTFLRAAAQVLETMNGVRFVIAGDGRSRGELENLAVDMGIAEHVEFTGQLDRESLLRRIGGAWVQVVPSLWPEPFGLATIEAMARATPVVASAAGGSVELIRDGDTGLLFERGDDDALAQAVLSLLENPDEARQMGLRAREFASEHASLDSFVDAFERLYYRVLERRAQTPGARNA